MRSRRRRAVGLWKSLPLGAKIATVFLAVVAGVAVLGPLLVPGDPNAQSLMTALRSPTEDPPFGTDQLGRDVGLRLLHACRVSLGAALLAVTTGAVLGVPIGLLSGYKGGRVDAVVNWVNNAVMSFPFLLLAMAIVGVVGPGLRNAMFAIGVVFAPRFLRISRAIGLSLAKEDYVQAAVTFGQSDRMIAARHLLPNALPALLVEASLLAGVAMIAEAGLSLLGLGVQPPQASWGGMLGEGFRVYSRAQWLIMFPGFAIFSTVFALNILADTLRDVLETGVAVEEEMV